MEPGEAAGDTLDDTTEYFLQRFACSRHDPRGHSRMTLSAPVTTHGSFTNDVRLVIESRFIAAAMCQRISKLRANAKHRRPDPVLYRRGGVRPPFSISQLEIETQLGHQGHASLARRCAEGSVSYERTPNTEGLTPSGAEEVNNDNSAKANVDCFHIGTSDVPRFSSRRASRGTP